MAGRHGDGCFSHPLGRLPTPCRARSDDRRFGLPREDGRLHRRPLPHRRRLRDECRIHWGPRGIEGKLRQREGPRVPQASHPKAVRRARILAGCAQSNQHPLFGSRFSTLNAKKCRPPYKVPNLIDAPVSTQKGRKGNDQHVHHQFYTPAAPRRVQHLGYRQDERRIARHRLQVPRPRRLLPEAAREEERPEQARPVQAHHPPMARGRCPEPAQAAPHRQAHMAQADRRARRRRQRVHRRPLHRRAPIVFKVEPDRNHGAMLRQSLGTPIFLGSMSWKSSSKFSSPALHGSAASPIRASRW